MFRFLTSLFAADTACTSRTPANTFRPQLTGLEVRDTPATLAAVAFDPQPEPPLATRTATVATTTIPGTYVPSPEFVPGPGFNTGGTRGIVVVGG